MDPENEEYETVLVSDVSTSPSASDEVSVTDERRGPRGRRGPQGPPMESCVVILKPEHPEYFIRNEANVVICTGTTIFPNIWLPEISSVMDFDCDYLTAHTTKSRLKVINLSDSPLTIKPVPGNKLWRDKSTFAVKLGKTVVFYGIGDTWYYSKS